MKGRVGNPGLKGRLLENSIEAYILSLETINRLSIKYRIENFTYLICNAWELMLKAKIIEDTKTKESIYFKKEKDKPRRSIALRDCLKKIFPNENDPTRRNIELVADMRDEVVHLVISRVPKDILALFQACVLNYHKKLVEWFNVSLSDRVSVGMMTIVYDFSPDQFDLNNHVLRRQLGSDALEYLTKFQADVRREFDNLGKSSEFSIDIGYKLALVKKVGDADIVLTTGNTGDKLIGILEVAKDPSKTHPYRMTEVVKKVQEALIGKVNITPHDILSIVEIHNIRNCPEFYYAGTITGSVKQYSQEFVDWIVKKYNSNQSFFIEAKEEYAKKLKQKDKTLGRLQSQARRYSTLMSKRTSSELTSENTRQKW